MKNSPSIIKKLVSPLAALAFMASSLAAPPEEPHLKEMEIRPDTPEAGRQVFTARFSPLKSLVYEELIFDCALCQEISLVSPEGSVTNRTVSSGRFVTRSRGVKMVKGVDCYVSFFVSLKPGAACDMSDDPVLSSDSAVKISGIKITAFKNGKKVWSYDVNPEGLFVPPSGLPASKKGETLSEVR